MRSTKPLAGEDGAACPLPELSPPAFGFSDRYLCPLLCLLWRQPPLKNHGYATGNQAIYYRVCKSLLCSYNAKTYSKEAG